MSDTPRTDAVILATGGGWAGLATALSAHARTLECELTTALAEVDKLYQLNMADYTEAGWRAVDEVIRMRAEAESMMARRFSEYAQRIEQQLEQLTNQAALIEQLRLFCKSVSSATVDHPCRPINEILGMLMEEAYRLTKAIGNPVMGIPVTAPSGSNAEEDMINRALELEAADTWPAGAVMSEYRTLAPELARLLRRCLDKISKLEAELAIWEEGI